MIRSALTLALTAALAVTAFAQQSSAQRIIPIRAATAVLDSDQTAGYPTNRTPHVWFNLENNLKIKPTGMTFSNVARASEWTQGHSDRWTAQGFLPPAVGTTTTKRDSIYWEIRPGQASDDQIANTDVILLPVYGFVSLNSIERERLRQFMDKGGVLWVDVSGTATMDPVNGFPLPFMMQTVPGPGTFALDFSQPLLSYPIGMSDADVVQLQSEGTVGMQPLNLATAGFGGLEGILQTLQPDSRRLQPVAVDALGTTISVGRVGDGYMVVTTRGVARTLNRIPSGAGFVANNGPRAITAQYDRTSDAAAKLVINMVHLVSGFNQGAKGSRGARSSPIDVGTPSLQRFADTTTPLTPIGPDGYQPPVVYKGVMVVTSQDQVLVYDTNPRQDLDSNGDPDDGERDYGRGNSWDLLWSSAPLAGPISAAVATEVPDAVSPNLRDQVLVVDSNGTLHGFSVFGYDVNGVIQGGTAVTPDYSVVPSSGAASFDFSAGGPGPYAPVVHDGFAYVMDAQDSGLTRVGRSYVVNPATGQQVRSGATGWSIGGVGAGGVLADPSGPPTIGYIPIQDNSGGLDRVMYIPSRANALGPTNTAGVTSIWMGAKGERPASATEGGGLLTVQTRAAGQGLDVYIPGAAEPKSLGVRLTILHPNGDPYTAAEMAASFTGAVSQVNGILTFGMTAVPLVPGFGVRVDYTIDWGTGSPALTSQVIRGQINLPDDANRARRVLHSIGLSSKGTMHIVFSSQQSSTAPGSVPGGAYYAIREEGRGTFKVLTRYDLYEPHSINLNQAGAVNYPEALLNNDPLVRPPSPVAVFLGGRMQRLTYVGGPSISNGTVYVTAKGIKPFGFFSIPYLIVMAFPAEPETPEIRVGDISGGFTILQPDVSRSAFSAGVWTPDTFTILQPGQFVYDRDPGGNAGTIRIDNLSATTRGPMVNCLNTSQPIIIRRNGQPDLLVEPNARASRWNRLLWYAVHSGVDGNSPPFVSGNTLFVAGASSWPTILAGAGFTPAGQVFGMDSNVSANDPFLNAPAADASRPWLRQFYQLFFDTPTDVRPNPAFRWPQLAGSSTFADYAIRLQQTVLQQPGGGYAGPARGVVGGDGGLFTWSNEGIWSFRKADFVIADEGRVTRMDSVGNPIWSVTGTYQSGRQGDVGAASASRPLVRPTRAYPLGDRQLLVVDTGANRVIRMDASGRELRSVADFRLDPTFRPAGLESGATLSLNGPRDALTYTRIVRAANNPLSDAQPVEYWVHYMVADSGNRRLVEVVDRYFYDPVNRQIGNIVLYSGTNDPAVGVLFWHSPAAYTGGKFVYSSLARVFVDDVANPRWVYAAGIGESMPARADLGLDPPGGASERRADDGNGGIVLFDGNNSVVVTEVTVPAVAANVYYDRVSGTFTSPAEPIRNKRLGNLNSVTMRNTFAGGGSQLSIMFADGEGVFEIVGGGAVWDVRWMMPKRAYTAMRRDGAENLVFSENPFDFRPTYAKRLDSGEVLICNGYGGWYQRSNPGNSRISFTGEVILIDGDFDPTNAAPFGFGFGKLNLGFKTLSVRVLLDNKSGVDRESRGVVLPLFADRQ